MNCASNKNPQVKRWWGRYANMRYRNTSAARNQDQRLIKIKISYIDVVEKKKHTFSCNHLIYPMCICKAYQWRKGYFVCYYAVRVVLIYMMDNKTFNRCFYLSLITLEMLYYHIISECFFALLWEDNIFFVKHENKLVKVFCSLKNMKKTHF